MQHTPSRFLKVAKPAELNHAPPAFTRFMDAHPRLSRFVVEHPKTSRFFFCLAHHLPVIERYVPLAAPIAPVYNPRARRPRWPTFGM